MTKANETTHITRKRARLTPNETIVLSELRRREGAPASAYDLKDALHGSGIRYPTTVYRALDGLIQRGLVHRIESANAFVACAEESCANRPVFAICQLCGHTTEMAVNAPVAAMTDAITEQGFEISEVTVEVRGRCGNCRAPA